MLPLAGMHVAAESSVTAGRGFQIQDTRRLIPNLPLIQLLVRILV